MRFVCSQSHSIRLPARQVDPVWEWTLEGWCVGESQGSQWRSALLPRCDGIGVGVPQHRN